MKRDDEAIPGKNEIATPFGLAMTTTIFPSFVSEESQKENIVVFSAFHYTWGRTSATGASVPFGRKTSAQEG